MIRALLCLCLILLFPLPAIAQGGGLSNPQTGIAGVYSAQARLTDHPHHVIMGHVIIVTRNGSVARALVLRQRDDGVHRLRFAAAWADGRALPFRAEGGLGCTHGHCRDRAVGMILLSDTAFAAALRDGLAARLTGPAGAIDITAPARLFTEAAALAAGR
jgi:hypothetical protein